MVVVVLCGLCQPIDVHPMNGPHTLSYPQRLKAESSVPAFTSIMHHYSVPASISYPVLSHPVSGCVNGTHYSQSWWFALISTDAWRCGARRKREKKKKKLPNQYVIGVGGTGDRQNAHDSLLRSRIPPIRAIAQIASQNEA